MHRSLTALVALTLLLGFALAQETPAVRTDLNATDLERVRAITAPTTDFSAPENFEQNQGGAGTVTKVVTRDIFSFSAANLTFEQEEQFKLGNALFRKLWVSAPASTEASDGLGPLFNARSCQACHLKDGRGHPPFGSHPNNQSMFLRLSIPPRTPEQIAAIENRERIEIPDPTYGTQLQDNRGAGAQGRGADGHPLHAAAGDARRRHRGRAAPAGL